MNQRIHELAREAGLPTYNPEGIPTKLEKFAELIIADCLKMCKTAVGTPDYNRGRMDCLDNIKEHFGVEL